MLHCAAKPVGKHRSRNVSSHESDNRAGKIFRLDCLIISIEINILILLNIVVSGDIFPV